MRRAALALSLLLLAAAAAGCLDEDGPGAGPGEASGAGGRHHLQVDAFPVALEHDHADPSLHTASAGVERIAHVATTDAGAVPAQGVYNLAIGTDLMVASLASVSGGGALAPGLTLMLVDVSEPEAPRALSRHTVPGGGVEAIAITPDDQFAFLGAEFSGAVGIWTLDLSDPASPLYSGFTPVATEGPHNVRYAKVGEQELVLASISHVATPLNVAGRPQDSNPVQDLRVDVYRFDRAAPERPMQLLSSYAAPGTEGLPQDTPIVHDAVVQTHPVTGKPVMYVAHWDYGVRLVDLSDPANPTELGSYAEPAPTTFLTTHTVKPHPTLIDGRHITVATAQCAYTPDAPCYVRILDTTDPAKPVQVGTWTLPEAVHGNTYTTEIFDLADGRVVVPWGHAGVWVLDLACEGCLATPQVEGYHFLGDAPPALGGNFPFANAVALHGGVAYVANVPSGIEVLRLPTP